VDRKQTLGSHKVQKTGSLAAQVLTNFTNQRELEKVKRIDLHFVKNASPCVGTGTLAVQCSSIVYLVRISLEVCPVYLRFKEHCR
jgi:coenzyme F420-reducing hydrogenase gamma subunit